jgi:ribosomal protein S18 acetylase RimI-like enzyme
MASPTQRGRREVQLFQNLIGYLLLAFGECMRTMRQPLATESVAMPKMTRLTDDQWSELREMRLSALSESPQMFLSTEKRERAYERAKWEEEFKRGDWYFGTIGDQVIGLIGVTREQDMPPDECYIEYMWVSPEFRRKGMGRHMLGALLDDLRVSGKRKVRLWVLDGNDTAVRLYERIGFVSTGEQQDIEERPGRTEARMVLHLT